MKASSCPNLNRETTSFTNFFTLLEQPDHDDTTLGKHPKVDHGDDIEASETSPLKDIILPCNEIGLLAAPSSVMMLGRGSEQKEQTLSRTSSVGSNLSSGNVRARSESPNFTQLRWDQTLPSTSSVVSDQSSGNVGARSEGQNFTQLRWDQTLPSTSSVVSNQSCGNVGARSEGPNFAQLRWDQTLPNSNQLSGNVGARSEGPNFTQLGWDEDIYLDFPDDEFRHAFKMSKSTFNLICTQLQSTFDEKDMQLASRPVPVISRVAVCIWFLATGEPLRLVSKRFGFGIPKCHRHVLEVCSAIKHVLMNKYLNWPDEENMTMINREFELVSGIQNVGGSMYTTHVPINAPKVNGPAYINKRHTERNKETSYTITVQGVVDSKGIFTDVWIGWPGSMTDDKILETSQISLRVNQGLLKDVWIVGSSGYPLMDWVLVPYAQQNLGAPRVFNDRVGRVQRVAKEAFRRLKGRWHCLKEITEFKLQDLVVVVGAACVLHNICEISNEAMDRADTSFDLFDLLDDEIVPENGERSVAATQARDQIAYHLLHQNLEGADLQLWNY